MPCKTRASSSFLSDFLLLLLLLLLFLLLPPLLKLGLHFCGLGSMLLLLV